MSSREPGTITARFQDEADFCEQPPLGFSSIKRMGNSLLFATPRPFDILRRAMQRLYNFAQLHLHRPGLDSALQEARRGQIIVKSPWGPLLEPRSFEPDSCRECVKLVDACVADQVYAVCVDHFWVIIILPFDIKIPPSIRREDG